MTQSECPTVHPLDVLIGGAVLHHHLLHVALDLDGLPVHLDLGFRPALFLERIDEGNGSEKRSRPGGRHAQKLEVGAIEQFARGFQLNVQTGGRAQWTV